MVRYFAYGSNLKAERMRERGAPFLAARPALLHGHRLAFDKRGFDGKGRANVTPEPGAFVHGVLYELEAADFEALRRFESGYDLVDVQVELAGERQDRLDAVAFVARPDRRTRVPPARSYVAIVLEGLEEHGLPAAARAAVERAARR